jgi:hypothetical protein
MIKVHFNYACNGNGGSFPAFRGSIAVRRNLGGYGAGKFLQKKYAVQYPES